MREGTTSRVTAADRPYGEFYDFYSVSAENVGYHHTYIHICIHTYIQFKVPICYNSPVCQQITLLYRT